MILLGLSTMGNSAACIFKDNKIIAAIEEERLSRIKNDGAFPIRSIKECLRISNLSINDIDIICVYWKPLMVMTRIYGSIKKIASSPSNLLTIITHIKDTLFSNNKKNNYPESTGRWLDLFFIKSILSKSIGKFKGKIFFFDHHLTHQLYAEGIKNISDTISLSYDGGGESYSTVVSIVNNYKRKNIKYIKWPNSLGHFYSFFTGYLGFKMLEGEYKMMGLAPYGIPRYKKVLLEEIIRLKSEGNYSLNTKLCDYHRAINNNYPKSLIKLFGPPRNKNEKPNKNHMDLAASVQAVFEDVQEHILTWAKNKYPAIKDLIISGGCGLNVTANGKILDKKLFRSIVVPPAPHDSGCCIGSAIAYIKSTNKDSLNLISNIDNPYLGSEYNDIEILNTFKDLKLPQPKKFEKIDLINKVVDLLIEKKIIAWFQGRSEFGPRALGSRSFLADPRDDSICLDINKKIKKRELFRPFAPSVIEEAFQEFFEISQKSPYMNIVTKVKENKKHQIPAIVHVDHTARIHTVSKKSNPLYHMLISKFGEKSGVPILLNTSFNIQEPIVNSPQDAINTFLNSNVDVLVIGDFICNEEWRKSIT